MLPKATGFEAGPGVFVKASCHHVRRGRHGACGACYARLYVALEEIGKLASIEAVRAYIEKTHAAMKAEGQAGKEGR